MLSLGDASNCGQYHSIGLLELEMALTAEPVITALLDLGEDLNPCK